MSATTIRSDRTIVAVLAAAGIVASLTQTIVAPLLGALPGIFDTDSSNTAWVVTITLLTGAVAMPVLGRLADQHGKRRVLMAALVPLVIGSVLCAMATSLPVMVVGRGLQGIATGLVPLGISLLHDVLSEKKVGSGIAMMSSSLGVGGALGLPLAAATIQFGSWRVLFWMMAVLAIACWVAIRVLVPKDLAGQAGRFDVTGALLLAAGLVGLLLPITKGATWGWTSTPVVGLLVAAVGLLLVWGWWELRTPTPLIDLRVTGRGVVLTTNIASIFVGFGMYAQSLLVPQLMQLPSVTGYGLGQSMLLMGLWLAPAGLAMMAVSSPGAALTKALGPKVTLTVGAVVMASGYAMAALLPWAAWTLMVTSVVVSIGTGLAFGALPALILNGVPATEKAASNSFNSLMRSIGTSTSSAVIAVVLTQFSFELSPGTIVPSADGFRIGFLIGCGTTLVAALLAACLPLRRPNQPDLPAEELESIGAQR